MSSSMVRMMRNPKSNSRINGAQGKFEYLAGVLSGFCEKGASSLSRAALLGRLKNARNVGGTLSQCRPFLEAFLEAVTQESPNVVAVCETIRNFCEKSKDFVTVPPTTPTKSSVQFNWNNPAISLLVEHWERPYLGPSCKALIRKLRTYEKSFSDNSRRIYYARTIAFTQSSGAGKSRLANEFGQVCPLVFFVLREPCALGAFPPSDVKVYTFMLSQPDSDVDRIIRSPSSSRQPDKSLDDKVQIVWSHALAIGLLQATFEICKSVVSHSDWYRELTEDRKSVV